MVLDERRTRPEVAQNGEQDDDEGDDREGTEFGWCQEASEGDRPDKSDGPHDQGPDDKLPDGALPERLDVEPHSGRTCAGR